MKQCPGKNKDKEYLFLPSQKLLGRGLYPAIDCYKLYDEILQILSEKNNLQLVE